ncbi:MAG: hypothetical protein ACQER4_01540 [Bacteroidota bacterium]
MSRNKENRTNLDEIVRRKVTDEFDVPYREEDWQAMKSSLDARNLHRSRVRRWRWLAVASLVVAAILGVAALQNHLRLNEITHQLAMESERILPHVPLLPVPDGRDHLPSSVRDEEILAADEPDAGDRESMGLDPAESESSSRTTDDNLEIAISGEATPGRPDRSVTGIQQPEAPTPVALATIRSDRRVSPPVQPVQAVGTSAAFRPGGNGTGVGHADPSHPGDEPARGLSLGLVLAPDLSMAGAMPGFGSPGLKAGVTLDLGLGSMLSLQTGVIYSGVRYSGDGRLYNPNGYSYGAVAGPESLHAVCHLLDIPVSLRLQLHQGDRSRIVAGAGVSSYIMLNERYRFDYAQSAPGQLREWEGATGTRHWASHVNLSVGYELSGVPGWNVRVEPYLRLPIRDVGRANVKLYSIGSLFSLNLDL